MYARNKRRLHFPIQQLVPGEVLEPRMRLDLLWTVETEPIVGFSLDHPVHKIGSLHRPILRNVAFLNLHLFGKDLIPDFFAITAKVRTLNIN